MITCILELFFGVGGCQLTEINESHWLPECFYTSSSQKIYDRLDYKNSPINTVFVFTQLYYIKTMKISTCCVPCGPSLGRTYIK